MNKASWPNLSKGEREGDIELLQVPNTKQTQDTLVSVPCCGAGGFYSTAGESGVMLFSGVPKRKTRSRRSEQNPLTCRDRAIQTRSEELWGQLVDDLHLSWESQGAQNRMENLWHFFFLIMRTPCVVSQGGRWHRIMKLNSSCHESCLNLKTRQSPGDWTVSYAQLLECHQITLFFQKVNEAFVQNLDVVIVILKWSSNIMRNWPWPQWSPKCGWKHFRTDHKLY